MSYLPIIIYSRSKITWEPDEKVFTSTLDGILKNYY